MCIVFDVHSSNTYRCILISQRSQLNYVNKIHFSCVEFIEFVFFFSLPHSEHRMSFVLMFVMSLTKYLTNIA